MERCRSWLVFVKHSLNFTHVSLVFFLFDNLVYSQCMGLPVSYVVTFVLLPVSDVMTFVLIVTGARSGRSESGGDSGGGGL